MQDIINLIIQYTTQVESLDQLNNTYIMTCAGFIGVILGIIGSLISRENNHIKKNKTINLTTYKYIASLFMSIPIVECIFICVSTLNCRKVAIYRGYLVYLEEQYNSILQDGVPQGFNSNALNYLSKWSSQNTEGSVVNRAVVVICCIILIAVFIASVFLGFKYLRKSHIETKRKSRKYTSTETIMYIAFIVIVILFFTSVILSAYDLVFNDVNIKEVSEQLKEIYS